METGGTGGRAERGGRGRTPGTPDTTEILMAGDIRGLPVVRGDTPEMGGLTWTGRPTGGQWRTNIIRALIEGKERGEREDHLGMREDIPASLRPELQPRDITGSEGRRKKLMFESQNHQRKIQIN